jgi:hypothetical protein
MIFLSNISILKKYNCKRKLETMRYPQNALITLALAFLRTTFAFTFIPNHIFGNLPSHQNAVLHGGCSMQAGSSAKGSPALGQKTALVTGATDGIGLHTATKLANAGYFVLIHGRYRPCQIGDIFCTT